MVNKRDRKTDSERLAAKYKNWGPFQDDHSDFDPEDAFQDLIQKDPTVCDNCFLLRYDVISADWWRQSFGWSQYERWLPKPGRSERIPESDSAGSTRLACAHCGHRRSKSRPVPKDSIGKYTHHISQTLDEKEIEHDRDRLFEEVRKRNTSEMQGRQDSDVFAPAVAVSIRVVQDFE